MAKKSFQYIQLVNEKNTETGTKKVFLPIKNKVGIYVCGITPDGIAHLGHAFLFVSFDVFVRYLKHIGYKTKTLLLVAFEGAEHFEDITKTMAKKMETLKAHKSQVVADNVFEKRIRERARGIGKKIKVKYAEGFKRIELS